MSEEWSTDDKIMKGWEWELETDKKNKKDMLKKLRRQIEELEFKIGKLSVLEDIIIKKIVRGEIKNADPDKVLGQHKKEMRELKKEKKKEKELEEKDIEIAYLNVKLKLLKDLAQ